MPIYARDAAALDAQASEASRNNANNNAKLQQLILGKKLDMEKAQEMLPINKQGEQDKSDIAVAGKNTQQQNEIKGIQGMQDSGMVNDGGGVKMGDTSLTRGYDPSKMAHQQQGQELKEMGALQKSAKASMGGPQGDLETADMIHKLAENPSSVDMGTAQIMKARMAMGGSGGRALGAALRTMGMDDNTLGGDAQKFANFFTGNSTASQTPQQINALKEGAFKLADDANERLGRAKSQFAQQAPFMAPGMAANGQLQQALPSFTAPADALSASLAQRKADYQKQAAGAQPGLTGGSAYKQPSGPIDKLAAFFGKGQAAPSGGTPPAASPQAPQAPMSFQEFQARKKAGTL
jgi:hypothetical protein